MDSEFPRKGSENVLSHRRVPDVLTEVVLRQDVFNVRDGVPIGDVHEAQECLGLGKLEGEGLARRSSR